MFIAFPSPCVDHNFSTWFYLFFENMLLPRTIVRCYLPIDQIAYRFTYLTQDSTDNLIQLDSANTSFELEDFDPLNKNARQIPRAKKQPPALPIIQPAFAALPAPAFSNPVYPFHVPNQQASLATTAKVDDDIELLRKYGLDRFHLNDSNQKYFSCSSSLDSSSASSAIGNINVNRSSDQFYTPINGNAGNRLQHVNGSASSIASKKDPWTTFD